MNTARVARLGSTLVALCTTASIWAGVVALTGGFSLDAVLVRVSSRNPTPALLIALLSGAVIWALRVCDHVHSGHKQGWWARKASGRTGLRGAQSERGRWVTSAAIAAIGAALTVQRWVNAPPLWLDEEMLALNVRDRSLAELAGPLWFDQTAPLGWLVVQRGILLTLGTGDHALRLLPALFAVATLVTAVWVGWRWMNPIGAVVLVVLCSWGQWFSYHALELKPYSADIFWGLFLPALAVWTIEARTGSGNVTRRSLIWWAAAAIGQWFANGALLVTPACALVALVMVARRHQRREALMFGLFGVVWLASFLVHYQVALRHAVNSEHLQSYWSFALPPTSAGAIGTLGWIAEQLGPLASKPGGSGWALTLWLLAACGFAFSTSSTLGIVLAAIPLSAFMLAAMRVVPLTERLSLWIVPALYTGLALYCDAAARLGRHAYERRSWIRLATAGVLAFVGFLACSDIFTRGGEAFRLLQAGSDNHQLDDRAGVRWLMDQHQAGDALMTTRLGLPALWWYGNIRVTAPVSRGIRLADGSPIFEVGHTLAAADCQRDDLHEALKDQRRALVYFGFRFDDVPEDFDNLLLNRLRELGTVSASRKFAQRGRAAVIDLRSVVSVNGGAQRNQPGVTPTTARIQREGCVVARLARRW